MIEPRRLWVEALRSGKYKQGFKALCRDDCGSKTYCCLGVACEVYQEHVGDLEVQSDHPKLIAFDKSSHFLPLKVAKWLNIRPAGNLMEPVKDVVHRDDARVLPKDAKFDSLSALNDFGANFDFNKIADVIESGTLKSFNQE
jgi:hypothetical protein